MHTATKIAMNLVSPFISSLLLIHLKTIPPYPPFQKCTSLLIPCRRPAKGEGPNGEGPNNDRHEGSGSPRQAARPPCCQCLTTAELSVHRPPHEVPRLASLPRGTSLRTAADIWNFLAESSS